jgi:RNA polymerase sigma-70 factor, ECF subfamily
LLTGFLDAARNGDLAGLERLLADDVTAWNDGGGRVRAARRPVRGRARVMAFTAGLVARFGAVEAQVVDVNGHPALRTRMGGQDQVVALDVRAGRIHAIYAVLDPAKLGRVTAPARAVGHPAC